jgi:hypothetical protein
MRMTYKDFYAQALLNSLPIAYAVEKDLVLGREPTPENVALGASQLAMALTDLLAKTIQNVPGANEQF